jgi:lysozyme
MRRTIAALCATIALLGVGATGAQAWTNGNAPPGVVAPISSGIKCTPLQGQLANEAASAWNTMALAAGERLPTNGCDSAYRPYERQVYWRNYWCARGACGNAATPGTSNHGIGLAVDVPQFVRGYIDLHGQRFGWCKCWSDAAHEWWHVKFNPAAFGRPNPGTSLKSPILRKGSGGPGQNVYVRKVQKLLRGHGDKSVEVDGEFGRGTAIAVRRFQKAERIKVNGVVSRRVWKRLRQPVVKPLPVAPAPAGPAPKPKPRPKPKPQKPPRPLRGVDTSSYQYEEGGRPTPINWRAARGDGVRFAYLKATEGQDYIDPPFKRAELKEAVKAGVAVGAYHFLRPRSDRKGAREAAWFTQVVGQAGAVGEGYLRPMLDVEVTTLDAAGTCRYVGSFLRLVRKNLGVKAIVYTTPGFARSYFSDCGWLGKYQLWVAHIGVDRPEVPAPWSRYAIWQHTWTGSVAGIVGDVDLNVMPRGLTTLRGLQIKELPARASAAPTAKVELPLEAEPREHLRNKVPAADKEPLPEVPTPEGSALAP